MRVDLDTGKYNVVISSSNFDVSIESGAKLDVNIGESARIDVNSAVTYIKSGKKEIDTYVEGKVKPDILEYSKVESQKFIDNYVPQTVEEYVDEVTKPSIDEYTDTKINQYNQNAVSKTDDFNTLAESLTNEYTSLAQTSEETLIQYVDSASLSAKNAKDSADVSTAQASISTAQAIISTTKASESLASANASSNSAISSENSAKASAKSLSDAEGVLANTIAQKDIAVSSANSAKESETKAKASETNAKTSENNAKASELSAKESASSSLASANQSQQSAVTSGEYANSSKEDAENASATLTKVLQSEASAKSYSESAKESSDIAVAKADAAKTSETNAKASEDKATSEATKSENSAKESQEFSESASLSAENASKSASSAKTSETNASQSATKSAQSEANALTYSQNAESSADSANNSVVECQAIKDSLGTIYKFKGSVQSVSSLPSGASIGDVYDVIDSGNNYAWTGSAWDSLGVNIDLSDYAKKGDIGDGTLTIQKNGVSIATFKANQTGDVTANIEADTLTSANAGTGISIDDGIISAKTNIEQKGTFNSSTTYKAGEIVRYYINSSQYQYFISLKNDNKGNSPNDLNNGNWAVLNNQMQLPYLISWGDYPICTIKSGGTQGTTPTSWRITEPDTTTSLANIPTINMNTGLMKAPAGIEGYYKSSEVDEALSLKQDALVSGDNIKTINGESLLGGGDVEITGGITYEDLNEDVTVNPTPIREEWETFKNELIAFQNGIYETFYPVGSIYIGVTSECPMASLISGSVWELVATDRVLQGSSSTHIAGSTINAGLPNIVGTFGAKGLTDSQITVTGCFTTVSMTKGTSTTYNSNQSSQFGFDASLSNSIYGASSTVQPPAYVVNIWQRIA
jgi:hypothetical protein